MTDGSNAVVAMPSEILQRLVAAGGSRIVLVVGAGISMEQPTNLKSGLQYSQDAYQQLINDGVLDPNDCSDPDDLSKLAEAVFDKYGSQKELTSRLPKDTWRTASPNTGHMIAAALLLEGSLRHVVTLNYDLALQNAMSNLGNSSNVTFIHGPDEHPNISTHSVMYLHRSVDQDEETWVLRKTALDSEWKNGWEEVIASSNLSAPIVIFIGLGSPAQVLTDSVERLATSALSSYYLVDRNLDSKFAAALGTNLTGTVALYWGPFMDRLAQRVVAEQVVHAKAARQSFLNNRRDLNPTFAIDIVEKLLEIDLVRLGVARSQWLLETSRYLPEGDNTRQQHVANLMVGLAWVGQTVHARKFDVDDQGRVWLESDHPADLVLGLAHGKGLESWASISTKIRQRNEALPPQQRTRNVLVAGATPLGGFTVDDLLRDDTSEDLIRGADTIRAIFIDEIPNHLANNRTDLIEKITL